MAEVVWIVVLILGALAGVAIGYGAWRRRRAFGREELRRRFGPEYDRAVEETGSGDAARDELRGRLRRVSRMHLRDLSASEREDYRQAFHDLEALFVDDPERAVSGLDRVAQEIVLARGYPIDRFDQQLADLSVHHARIVSDYRSARALSRQGASPDELRRALGHYRVVIAALIRTPLAQRGPLAVERALEA